MYRDAKSKNFQKNLTNRRGDLTVEAVTLHRRFPYAVLTGWLFLERKPPTTRPTAAAAPSRTPSRG